MKKIIILVLLIVLLTFVGYLVLGFKNSQPEIVITNFEECVNAGYPIMESYPEQCKTPDGRSFVRDIGNELDYSNEIQVNSPRPNQVVTSPLSIEGQAKGNWYFEASFPVELVDANGKSLIKTPVEAKSEWMTTEFVPFSLNLTFTKPETKTGKLILRNDNPSGLEENQKELIIPIKFE